MTARGKQVKFQTLLADNEIFVYDRVFISPPSSVHTKPSSRQAPVPPAFSPKAPPDILASQTDLQAWQNLFLSRKAWALDLASKCASMSESVRKQYEEVAIIERAVVVANTNLETHVRSLEQRHVEAKAWASDVLKEQQIVIAGRDVALAKLASIPVKETLLQFIVGRASDARPSTPQQKNASKGPTLADFVDVDDVKRAGSTSRDITQNFAGRVAELGEVIEKIISSSQELADRVKRDGIGSASENSEESKRLMEDIEVVVKKVGSDYEHVLGLANSPRSVSQASKMALLHTRNYLPSLSESGVEMGQILRLAVEQRNLTAISAEQHLQAVSTVESMLANVNPQLSGLDIGAEGVEAFDLLSLVSRLPAAYGSLLVESVRRREWSEKIKADSSTLAEELAILKDEEERRRKKWQRNIGSLVSLDTVDDKALRVEVNLQGEGQPWPHITRQDVDDFVKVIRGLEGMDGVVKEMALLIKDLDRPTRHQSRRAKAFKMGSVHEAALGRSSLLLRGDDDLVRSLKVEKSKLEDKLKGSESRVRKLEDLLHRQSHISRNSSGNVFQVGNSHGQQGTSPVVQNASLPSPRPEDALSRRSSISSRRFSVNQSPEEKALAQRIVALEVELTNEREHTAGLQREAFARKEAEKDIRTRIEEANSTKEDLMANLEAQQQEFVDERKLLEDEIAKHKVRVEEVEDELDRVLGSRDNEKAGIGQRIHALEAELEKTRKEAAEEVDKLRQQVNHHREMADSLDKSASQAKTEKKALHDIVKRLDLQLQKGQEVQSEHVKALRAAHLQLSPSEVAPEDLTTLVEGIEILAEKLANHSRDLETRLTIAHADTGSLQDKVEGLEKELLTAKDKLGSEEMESFTLREAVSEEKAKTSVLRTELEDERLQLSELRAKLADGETGSFALRERLAEEEGKAARLVEEVGVTKAKLKSLEEELESVHCKLSNMQAASEGAASRLGARTTRAKDLTQRLYAQNDRLSRLLESLGFAITHRDDSMIIQKISRTGSASVTDLDPSSSLGRSVSGAVPLRKTLEDSGDLELLYWMHAEDSDTESEKFEAFISRISKFDLDAFSEAITKRVKETEHMARKWQKEARAYRDKSHRAQLEAHEKIAFRSFKEGDLALFLPTRNQATRPWAAFNVGAPHYFLREQDSHKLRTRDWLLARISKVQERVVDLSKCMSGVQPAAGDRRSIGESSDGGASFEDENPFELSDGLRWYLLDAAEEKPGAPSTPGLGKSTVASAHVDAKGSIRVKKAANQASKTLSKSLDSRRGSSGSKKDSAPAAVNTPVGANSPDASRAATSTGQPPTNLADAAPKASEEAAVNQEQGITGHPAAPQAGRVEKASLNLWDSLFSLDLSYESGRNGKQRR